MTSSSSLQSGTVPLRSAVQPSDTWDLTPLYAEESEWEADFSWLQAAYPAMVERRGRAAQGAQELREILEYEKSLDMRVESLSQYAALRVTEDSSNAGALAREARLESLLLHVAEACSFLSPEIQSLPDDLFAAYLDDPILSEWWVSLKKLRRMKAHTLSAPEERLLALASSALRGHAETFSQLTNVDMVFGSLKDGRGVERQLTQSSFSSFLQDSDRAVRREAFKTFYAEFQAHQFTLASSLAHSVRADVFSARARHFPSALEAALYPDDIPVSVYDNLCAAVRARLPALFRYFSLRRRVLGLDDLHHYDTYVPLVAEISSEIPWDQAVDKVIEALRPLGEDYTSVLEHGLRSGRWCDRYENKGKRSGAFSYGTFRSPPYIMMNYKADVFSDVYTLAHEAGHSMHTWFSTRAQNFQNYHYPIFLAEVASTFNEILLTEHLLNNTDDTRMRAYLINRQIDDLRGTLFRQTMFAEFERDIHFREEAGEALTLDAIQTAYRRLLGEYFPPDFVLDDELALEGLRIPHFYGAFYVYKYATGISAAVALAENVLSSGCASQYRKFLSSGGSRFPLETLADAGVDMTTPAPVEAALGLFERRIDELENLLMP